MKKICILLLTIILLTITSCTKVVEEKEESIPEEKIINSLDKFYQDELTKGIKDVREISKDYTISEAEKDNCFVMTETNVYNDNLFTKLFDNYENKKDAFLRVVELSIEGDMIIYDIMYKSDIDKFYLVIDTTRDENSNKETKLENYEKMTQYLYQDHTYWVLYNGELTDKSLFGENTFIISYV